LLGHSFGGYLTVLYALQYPQNINLLVLADPWGMTEKPSDWKPRSKIPLIPGWVKALGSVLINFGGLAILSFLDSVVWIEMVRLSEHYFPT
jgi:pimeloyl-ACP methyl ester carboxylesterase